MAVNESPRETTPTKRQTTLDESNIDVPEAKRRKTEPEVPETVKSEPEAKAEKPISTSASLESKEHKSEVLEKGLIYFLFRPKVDHEKITKVVDVQRSYIILRPVPEGATLDEDTNVNKLSAHFIELPKKQMPESGDQFMGFVASGEIDTNEMKERLAENSYSTNTRGERMTPAARPFGEGVYSLVSHDGSTHLCYRLITPSSMGEVQKEFGVHDMGRYVLSTKNPESSSRGIQVLPSTCKFPESLHHEFGSRSWLPTRAEHLAYDGCGLLFIGTKPGELGELDEDGVLEQLGHEDESRESIRQIFQDLGITLKTHESKPLLGEFA